MIHEAPMDDLAYNDHSLLDHNLDTGNGSARLPYKQRDVRCSLVVVFMKNSQAMVQRGLSSAQSLQQTWHHPPPALPDMRMMHWWTTTLAFHVLRLCQVHSNPSQRHFHAKTRGFVNLVFTTFYVIIRSSATRCWLGQRQTSRYANRFQTKGYPKRAIHYIFRLRYQPYLHKLKSFKIVAVRKR